MKSWNQWMRRRNSKRTNRRSSHRLRSEILESRQLLAGDVLQAGLVPDASDDVASVTSREPRAALSLNAAEDLQFEFDSNERQIASVAKAVKNASVAGNSDGSYVVVRQQLISSRRGYDLFGQRYDSNGDRVGGQFRVNAISRGDQINPQIAVSSDGSFSVVWQSRDDDDDDWNIMTRSFDADGVATRTREYVVHSETSGDQVNPSIAYLDSANYVVAWNGRGHGKNADGSGIFAQRIALNDPVGDQIRVNSYKPGLQSQPAVAASMDGDFVIAWQGNGDGDSSGIYMRKFFVDGQDVTRSREIRVNSLTAGDDQHPSVGISSVDDTMLVSWQNELADDANVRGQLFDASLNRIGSTLDINQTVGDTQQRPSVTALSQDEETGDDGEITSEAVNDFVITWEGAGAEDSYGIYSRRMSSTGEMMGDEVLVNKRNLDGDQTGPAIANVGTGVEIVWSGNTSTGRNGIFRRGFKDAALNVSPEFGELEDVRIDPPEDNQSSADPYTFTVDVTDPDNTPIVRVHANNGATVEQDETDDRTFTITPAVGFEGRINVTLTAQDLVNPIVRSRFTLLVAQAPPTLTISTGSLNASTGVREIAVTGVETRVPFVITDPDTELEEMRVTRIVTEGDARVKILQDTSEVVVTAVSDRVSKFTLIVYDGTNRVKQDVQVTFDGDAPVVDLSPGADGIDTTATVVGGVGTQRLGIDVEITDLTSTTLAEATVTVINGDANDILSVTDTDENGITVTVVPDTDEDDPRLVLSGAASISEYDKLLKTLAYHRDVNDDVESRDIQIIVSDGANPSAPATIAVTIGGKVDHVAFARALSDAVLYGAYWNEDTTEQKELFQDGQSFLPYVEVTDSNRELNEVGTENDIDLDNLPVWVFPNGTRLTGVQTAQAIADAAGISVPVVTGDDAQPFVHDVEIVTNPDDDGDGVGENALLVGSPLYIPLDGYDADGDEITYTVTSSNPDVVPTIPSGNRSLRLNVAGFGDMVFELFEDEAPLATERIIQLAEDGFYEDIIFHRVLNDFVIQTGDPEGTGSGGSDLDDFDDQFDVDLQHNRTGLLSMAKTNDDTNNSQFFVTEGPSRHLDFNHTIFGILTEGEAVRQAISNVETVGGRPLINVTIQDAEIFTDTENAVVQLKANAGATGSATITVRATDTNGEFYETSFDVNLEEDTFNGGPFLNDFNDELEADVNTPITFTLDATDIEGDPVFFDMNASGLGENAEAEIDNETGEITVTPTEDFSGKLIFVVGVRAEIEDPNEEGASDTQDRFDAQDVTLYFGDKDALFDVVTRGEYTDDDLLGIRADELDGAPEVTVNEHVDGALDYSAYTNPPTYGPHHPPLNDDDGTSIVPRPTGVYSTAQPDEDLIHNLEHGHVWISYNPSMIGAADLQLLENFVNQGGTNAGVILTPRPRNDSAIAVASWAHLLKLDSFDDQMLRDFVNTNRGHAPEGYITSGQKTDASETVTDGQVHTSTDP